ncbi:MULTISPECIES: MaoC family dehydratase [unclassified Nocardioides]|uniref:MaoC family dehydratase n=1 Tax=unclassified Nocardioides TaxID=2615069 RepID=UPI000056F5B6|nr:MULTISPECIES: MaoC family dehydratase [unclassified Nocardioides]
MSVRVFTSTDELSEALGTHVGYSGWHTVSQEQIDGFADATGDHQWIHVDPERAGQGPFGGTIAHGYLTLSMVPMMTWETMRIEGLSMEVNYGAEKVRFPAPVLVGSRVRAGIELLTLAPAGDGYRLTSRITVERDGGDKPVCVVDAVSYLVA